MSPRPAKPLNPEKTHYSLLLRIPTDLMQSVEEYREPTASTPALNRTEAILKLITLGLKSER